MPLTPVSPGCQRAIGAVLLAAADAGPCPPPRSDACPPALSAAPGSYLASPSQPKLPDTGLLGNQSTYNAGTMSYSGNSSCVTPPCYLFGSSINNYVPSVNALLLDGTGAYLDVSAGALCAEHCATGQTPEHAKP